MHNFEKVTIPAKLGLIWFDGFKEENLNVQDYDQEGHQVLEKH
jgi:hypothetical protein